MKLTGDFFSILSTSTSEAGFIATITLNPGHIVYTGHFPGHSVTPGVIQLQIVHELLEKQMGRKLTLQTISQCKFLNILDPKETPVIAIHIAFYRTGEQIHIKAYGENNEDTYFKLNSAYQFCAF